MLVSLSSEFSSFRKLRALPFADGEAMWETLWFGAGLVTLAGLFWGLSRLLQKANDQDRRYGNPDDWGSAGDHY
jgi:hypothetical protein